MLAYLLKLALRSARSTPGITALATVALALGVSVPTTIISIRHALVRDPLPGKSDRLFNVRVDSWELESDFFQVDPGDPPKHITYRDMSGLMASELPKGESGVAVAAAWVFPPDRNRRPFRTTMTLCHADLFDMVQAPFAYGSPWSRKDDAGRARTAVLSHEGNLELFGGENSVGKTFELNGKELTVVGVLAPWYPTPNFYDVINNALGAPRKLFLPFDLVREQDLELELAGDSDGFGAGDDFSKDPDGFYTRSENHWIQYWVELDPADRDAYAAFVDAYAAEQKKAGRFPRPINNRVSTLMEWMAIRRVAPPVTGALSVISVLFLLVCALNLSGLLLGKFLSRAPVYGVHRALGASRASVFAQTLLECEVVALAGGAAGVALAAGAVRLLNGALTSLGGHDRLFYVDGTMLAVALGLSLAGGFAAGIYPAWRACRVVPALQLKLS